MADMIRINELPVSNNPQRDDLIPIDGVDGTKAAQLVDVVKAGTDLATDIEAVAGTNTTKTMTPFTTKAAIDAKVDGHFAPTSTTITVGFGMVGGGSIANNVFINFSQQTIDSLAKADTAAQAADVSAAIAPLASKNYVDSVASSKVDKPINGTDNNLIKGNGATISISDFVMKSGDTMSGPLILSGNPTNGNEASNKSYIDNLVSEKISKSGGTMSGSLTMGAGIGIGLTKHPDAPSEAGNVFNVINGDGVLDWWDSINNRSVMNINTITRSLSVPGDIYTSSNLYLPNGQVAQDGNIRGTRWGNQWLYDYLQNTNTTLNVRAYPRRSDGGAMNFYWSGQSGQPTWLWGGTDGTNMYVYNPANFNVNAVGGWTQATIADQLNWRVTDTRFAGWYDSGIQKNNNTLSMPSGYVMTGLHLSDGSKNFAIYGRQPQIHIPNVGWRALGGW